MNIIAKTDRLLMRTILFVALISCALHSHAQHTVRGDEVRINSSGYLTSYTGPGGSIVIPDQVDGMTITGIADGSTKWDGVFADKHLTEVRLPKSLAHIGDFAFYGNALTTVTIPGSVTAIGASAFYINSLREIVFESPGKLTQVGDLAFCGNQLTRVALPASLKTIGKQSFFNNAITDLTLPRAISSIGSSAFNLNKIATVNDQPSKGIIYGRTHDGKEDKTIIMSYGGAATVIDFIAPSVSAIGEGAFYGNKITSVIIPENVKFMGARAFRGNALEKVTIPKSIKEIPEEAFQANELKQVIFHGNISWIGEKAFAFNGLKEVTLPTSVIWIGARAFTFNPLKSLTLPSPQKQGHTFIQWTGNGGAAHKAGAVVNDLDSKYTAVFEVSR